MTDEQHSDAEHVDDLAAEGEPFGAPAAVTDRATRSRPIRVTARGASDQGLVRQRNEDVFLILDLTDKREAQQGKCELDLGERGMLLAVLDGMGGAAHGDVASRLGAEVIVREVTAAAVETREELADAIEGAARVAHGEIRKHAAAEPSCHGMGTTFTAGALVDDQLVLAHVGDSRAYLFRGDQLVQLTEDQSLLNELFAAGRITEEELPAFEHANVILQALGVNDRVFPHIGRLTLRCGDVLLLCSDGLSDLVSREELQQVIREHGGDLEEAAARLVEQAKRNGGYDNITLVLARFDGEGLEQAGDDEPVEVKVLRSQGHGARFPLAGGGGEMVWLVGALILMVLLAGVIIVLGRT